MKREAIIQYITSYVERAEDNIIHQSFALDQSLSGTPMYNPPLIRFGDAGDPLFVGLKSPQAIGPHYRLPSEWLEGAQTVISIFLPTSQPIRQNNRQDMSWPSSGWLHARIEGQAMIVGLTTAFRDWLRASGYDAVAPCIDGGLVVSEGRPGKESPIPAFSSNWSERHTAYICGHGTFGLSKGLITEQGVAGRFTSIITSLHAVPDERRYTQLYQYCSMCGACIRNCPAGAITLEAGKDHRKCSAFLERTRASCTPRYGCGKCQVKVPCETGPCQGWEDRAQ